MPINEIFYLPSTDWKKFQPSTNKLRTMIRKFYRHVARQSPLFVFYFWSTIKAVPFIRVGQVFWVYGIQGSYKSGIWYIYAEIWVLSISFVLFTTNFGCKRILRSLQFWVYWGKFGYFGYFFSGVYWYTTGPPGQLCFIQALVTREKAVLLVPRERKQLCAALY